MPLTPDANIWNHIFGINLNGLSGFHSKAKWNTAQNTVKINRTINLNDHSECYQCEWGLNANGPYKISDMFPNKLDENGVKAVVQDAIDYWNNATGHNQTRLISQSNKHGCGWAGQCKINGYTVVVGGMSGGGRATSAFPLKGENANY